LVDFLLGLGGFGFDGKYAFSAGRPILRGQPLRGFSLWSQNSVGFGHLLRPAERATELPGREGLAAS
jgi:hypothetical protein